MIFPPSRICGAETARGLALRPQFPPNAKNCGTLANSCTFGTLLAFISGKESTLTRLSTGTGVSPMYLFFAVPALAFVTIFAISLRNQFADHTNL